MRLGGRKFLKTSRFSNRALSTLRSEVIRQVLWAEGTCEPPGWMLSSSLLDWPRPLPSHLVSPVMRDQLG